MEAIASKGPVKWMCIVAVVVSRGVAHMGWEIIRVLPDFVAKVSPGEAVDPDLSLVEPRGGEMEMDSTALLANQFRVCAEVCVESLSRM
jgi:hypothetical protein